MSELDKFLEERLKIPIPEDDFERSKLFAVELALGADRGLWRTNFALLDRKSWILQGVVVEEYLRERGLSPEFQKMMVLLHNHGYVHPRIGLTDKAFSLVEFAQPHEEHNMNVVDFIKSLPVLPANPGLRIRYLARELVLGTYEELWNTRFFTLPSDKKGGELVPLDGNLRTYLGERWGDHDHHIARRLQLLQGRGYVRYVGKNQGYELTEASYDLVEDSDSYNVFISYKRSENSMLVLLVSNTLKLNRLEPFFDMMLNPTEEWHARFGRTDQEV